MSSPFQRLSMHAKVFYTTTALTCISQVGVLVVILWLSTSPPAASSSTVHSIKPFALTAAVLDILCLILTAATTVFYLRRDARRIVAACCIFTLVIALPAFALSIYTFARLWITTRGDHHANLRSLVLAGIITWPVALLATIIFVTIILRPQPKHERYLGNYSSPRKSPADNSITRSISVRMAILDAPKPPAAAQLRPEQPAQEPKSRRFSPPRRPPRRDFQTQGIKPVTSRSRLIHSTSFTSRSSRSSKETLQREAQQQQQPRHVAENADFQNWDTSSVEATMDALYTARSEPASSVASLATTTTTNNNKTNGDNGKRRLETIPGSRPASPAFALDGPFPATDSDTAATEITVAAPSSSKAPEEAPVPEPSRSPIAPSSSHSQTQQLPQTRPEYLRRPSRGRDFAQGIQAQSQYQNQNQGPNQDQAHIHPLFRTQSPNPHPQTSPGTNITADLFMERSQRSSWKLFPSPTTTGATAATSATPLTAGARQINGLKNSNTNAHARAFSSGSASGSRSGSGGTHRIDDGRARKDSVTKSAGSTPEKPTDGRPSAPLPAKGAGVSQEVPEIWREGGG